MTTAHNKLANNAAIIASDASTNAGQIKTTNITNRRGKRRILLQDVHMGLTTEHREAKLKRLCTESKSAKDQSITKTELSGPILWYFYKQEASGVEHNEQSMLALNHTSTNSLYGSFGNDNQQSTPRDSSWVCCERRDWSCPLCSYQPRTIGVLPVIVMDAERTSRTKQVEPVGNKNQQQVSAERIVLCDTCCIWVTVYAVLRLQCVYARTILGLIDCGVVHNHSYFSLKPTHVYTTLHSHHAVSIYREQWKRQ
jgi:hypothetical protein